MNRKRSARLTVLLATDGSRQAHAALAFAAAVPWAGTVTAHTVLGRGGIPLGPWPTGIGVSSDHISFWRSALNRRVSLPCASLPITPPSSCTRIQMARSCTEE